MKGIFCSILVFALLTPGASAASITRGPYLQLGTPTSMVIRWRTDEPADSEVRFGMSPNQLDRVAARPSPATEHEIELSGLAPGTRYYYSVGGGGRVLAGGDNNHYFVTAPAVGTAKPLRIWVLGDPGTAGKTGESATQAAVRDAYYDFTGDRRTDLWLLLGDNAYDTGTDLEYQRAIFNMYSSLLAQSVVWPSRGNHDIMADDGRIPYFDNFTMPTQGEAGGIPSGTEAYYSFDHANVHFICVDSEAPDLSPSGPMAEWLRRDLAVTTQDWIIAFAHHAPYSKGSHDTDSPSQTKNILIRENIVPILEAGGVDLFLAGHSHSYERSYLLDGHYGVSSTLTPSMVQDAGSGRVDESGPYRKPFGITAHEGTVYVVSGSAGSAQSGAYQHPAIFTHTLGLGSVVMDIDGLRLDAKFLRDTGEVSDYFTMIKEAAQPTVGVIAVEPEVSENAISAAKFSFVRAGPVDRVLRIPFTVSGTAAPGVDYRTVDSAIEIPAGEKSVQLDVVPIADASAEGIETVTVRIDDVAEYRIGAQRQATVQITDPKPDAPRDLRATPFVPRTIELSWSDGERETEYIIERRIPPAPNFFRIGSAGKDARTYTDVGVEPGTEYEYRIRASSAAGDSPYSATVRVSMPVRVGSTTSGILAGGTGHSVMTAGDGSVWAWGENTDGQLGTGLLQDVRSPVQVGGFDGATVVGAGNQHSVALREDGTVWAWGENAYGQLGDGSVSSKSTPVRVLKLADATAVAAGRYFSAAVRRDGSVWTWGNNLNGQLGDPSILSRLVAGPALGFGADVRDVAAGRHHLLALKHDGTVWATGDNEYGQLGVGHTDDIKVPVQILGLQRIVRIAAGEFHSLAIDANGSIWVWGRNEAGQLGIGSTQDSNVPAKVGASVTFIEAAAGVSHSVALSADGVVWSWGNNSLGQLGDGSSNASRMPEAVAALSSVISIASGGNHSLAVTADGSVWAWGGNSSGQSLGGSSSLTRLPIRAETLRFVREVGVAPAAPRDLQIQAGDTKIELTWSSVPGAESYRIRRARSVEGPFSVIATVTAPKYNDGGLVNGRTYFYRVVAVSLYGESEPSEVVSVTPKAVVQEPPSVSLKFTTLGEVQLEFRGLEQRAHVIEISDDLRTWLPAMTNLPLDGVLQWTDGGADESHRRFYRIR